MDKPKLLVFSDFCGFSTGFATVAYNLLTRLEDKYDIHHVGTSYTGDYHELQRRFKLYVTSGQDPFGISRAAKLVDSIQPALILVINDMWISSQIVTAIKQAKHQAKCVLYTPIDSPHLKRVWANPNNQFDRIITYTEFAKNELLKAGVTRPINVIPHGVDTDTFFQVNKEEARDLFELPKDDYIVLYVASNQPRKRVDLFFYILNEWLRKYPHNNVKAYYHGAANQRSGIDVYDYLDYLTEENKRLGYDIDWGKRSITTDPNMNQLYGMQRDFMRHMYSCADVYLAACAVEGWGLPIHEALACKLPTIVADYSALSEWPKGGVQYVPVSKVPTIQTNQLNTEHRYLDVDKTVESLEYLYQNEQRRNELSELGYVTATQDKFKWSNIALEFDRVFTELLEG